MNLREYQAKAVFVRYGIATPRGALITSPEKTGEAVKTIGCPVVLKPQLGVKGRGKVGAIAFADTVQSAQAEAERLFALVIKGEAVRTILIEQKLPIVDELYIAVTIDYSARQPVLMLSKAGGIAIEDVAARHPDRILKIPVNILTGPTASDRATVASQFGDDVTHHVEVLYRIFREYDAEMVEINPLIRTTNNTLYAADAVLNVNEDSLFRHDELTEFQKQIPINEPLAVEASQKNWTYIELSGDIGILSSGAGLTMTILDLLHQEGGQPANFLDTAQIDDQGIYEAFELLTRARPVSVLLVNIFAGLNRCDSLARGIKRYLHEHPLDCPLVVRMIGNFEHEGHQILQDLGIKVYTQLEDAIKSTVQLSKKRHQ